MVDDLIDIFCCFIKGDDVVIGPTLTRVAVAEGRHGNRSAEETDFPTSLLLRATNNGPDAREWEEGGGDNNDEEEDDY